MTTRLWFLPCFLALSATAAAQKPAPVAASTAERGKYLVNGMGCHDCHTPKKMGPQGPEPDMVRMLSGQPESPQLPPPPKLPPGPWIAVTNVDLTAWSGPWGISYAFNLTPDEKTGLGSWSEETFVKAMRTGRHMGASRPILPPMPWFDIAGPNGFRPHGDLRVPADDPADQEPGPGGGDRGAGFQEALNGLQCALGLLGLCG